jgi:hypothetical protein
MLSFIALPELVLLVCLRVGLSSSFSYFLLGVVRREVTSRPSLRLGLGSTEPSLGFCSGGLGLMERVFSGWSGGYLVC